MASYTSGSIRFSGLGSDVDFEDMISKLYSIESTQANKLIQWKEDWTIRRSAFTEVRESLVELQTALGEISSTDTFLVKSATSSNAGAVSATVSASASEGTHRVEVGQLASNSIWSISTGLADKDTVVNSSNTDGSFTYTYKGKSRTVKVPAGSTLESLKNIINNDSENLGVRVQLIQSGGEVVFQLSGLDTGQDATLSIDATVNLDGLEVEQEATWSILESNELFSLAGNTSSTEILNTTETPKNFVFELNGESHSVKLKAGGTLEDLRDAVNDIKDETGVTANVAFYTDGDGNVVYGLHLSTEDDTDLLTIGNGTLEGFSGMIKSTNWQQQQGQNAEIRVNGWPKTGWLEVGSNSVDDVVDGVTFNLRDEGIATVTVDLDTDAIEKNVEKFVDAVNSFRTLILELTKVDEDKTTLDPDYAETQSEMQMGSALTGNYGVQLISSNLKSATASSAKGFNYLQEVEGTMFGDMFTSLSQIGIYTDTDSSSPTFGLLVINKDTTESTGYASVLNTSSMTLSEALAKDSQAVAKLFAANYEGKSNSNYFAVNSLVSTMTKPGNYDVKYTTDDTGAIIEATINGKEAKVGDGTLSLTRQDPTSTDSSVATALSDGSMDATYLVDVRQEATKATTTIETLLGDRGDSINQGTDPIDFSYEFNGVTRTIEIAPGSTLNDLVAGINRDGANPGVTAKVVSDGSEPPAYNLVLEAKNTGANSGIGVTADEGAFSGAAKTEEAGRNAEYRYVKVTDKTDMSDPFAGIAYKESAGNGITLESGLTATLHGAGTTTIKAQKHNDADGILLDIYDLSPGQTFSGTFSVRQGKVNELLDMLGGSDGILGANGSLKILENNYDQIISNINDKIKKEDDRLTKWERVTRLRFSRLEATLSTYSNLQTMVESQVEQLKSSS